jgi:purine-binding chemotaxis protein CheW
LADDLRAGALAPGRSATGLSMMLVTFVLDEYRYALPLAAVERVVRAVAITGVPEAPRAIAGVVNMRGEIVPVVNLRRRFGLPERAMKLSDQLIVARTAQRTFALMADEVTGVVDCGDQDILATDSIMPGMRRLDGVAKEKAGVLLVMGDLDKLLSPDEEHALEAALENS